LTKKKRKTKKERESKLITLKKIKTFSPQKYKKEEDNEES